MELLKLCDGLDLEIKGNSNVEITGITYDSRKIMPGYIFAALHGSKDEGGRYISDALSRGASAVLCDDSQLCADNAVILVSKGDVAESLGKLSSKFYGNPSKSMNILAVTGTNGKTTITYMLEKIFRRVGKELGIVGTIAYRYGQINIPAPNTTPQSSDLHKVLRDMKDLGAWGAAMEVSSHGLVQNRIAGCDIDSILQILRMIILIITKLWEITKSQMPAF